MINEQRPDVDPARAELERSEPWTPPVGYEAPTETGAAAPEAPAPAPPPPPAPGAPPPAPEAPAPEEAPVGAETGFAPLPEDAYVAIDERVADTFGLVITTWPTIDADGRLRFPGRDTMAWFDAEQLQLAVDRHRERRGQLARPLRISDVFWIRGFGEDPDQWVDLMDITEWARDAAKVAVYSVATGPVPEEAAGELGLVPKDEAAEHREPPTLGPTATAAV